MQNASGSLRLCARFARRRSGLRLVCRELFQRSFKSLLISPQSIGLGGSRRSVTFLPFEQAALLLAVCIVFCCSFRADVSFSLPLRPRSVLDHSGSDRLTFVLLCRSAFAISPVALLSSPLDSVVFFFQTSVSYSASTLIEVVFASCALVFKLAC